jgi:RimJ/RimL family protein N-acetyltransferase
MITLRAYREADWSFVWPILEPVFRAGETYAFDPGISETEAHQAWIESPKATFVAVNQEQALVGTYYIKPNQPGLGSHVCNCGYVVAGQARGQGVATAMCRHSLAEALNLGFRAMQFNLVVATNHEAIHLWQKLGFQVIGTLPQAFRHQTKGYVAALVMYRQLIQ